MGYRGVCQGETFLVDAFLDATCDGEPVETVPYETGCSKTIFGENFRRTTGCNNPAIFCSGLKNRDEPSVATAAAKPALGFFVTVGAVLCTYLLQ